MFEFPAPLESLPARAPLEWMSVDRIGTALRLVARIHASATTGAG